MCMWQCRFGLSLISISENGGEKTVELYVWILSFPNETLDLYTSKKKKIHYT